MRGFRLVSAPFLEEPSRAVILLLACDESILRIDLTETVLWETWGQAIKETRFDYQRVEHGAAKGPWSQLRWSKCDCQSGS